MPSVSRVMPLTHILRISASGLLKGASTGFSERIRRVEDRANKVGPVGGVRQTGCLFSLSSAFCGGRPSISSVTILTLRACVSLCSGGRFGVDSLRFLRGYRECTTSVFECRAITSEVFGARCLVTETCSLYNGARGSRGRVRGLPIICNFESC